MKKYMAYNKLMSQSLEFPFQDFVMSRSVDYKDHLLNTLIVETHSQYAQIFLKRFRVSVHHNWPKDWWEAFKERWAPAWFLARWPVKYHGVNVERDEPQYVICPHINKQHGRCLEWMGRISDIGYPPFQALYKLDTKMFGRSVFLDCDNAALAKRASERLRDLIKFWCERFEYDE